MPQNTAGGNNNSLNLLNIKAPKNGYAYIYISNESIEPVYFDNFKVSHTRGRIIEENHYYAFGLKIAGISAKKLGDGKEGYLTNKNLYNDKELFEEADFNWYDYGFRNYDVQIARFTQLDPLTWDYTELTPYQYASNDPIANIDIDGLEGGSAIMAGFNGTFNELAEVVVTASKTAKTGGSTVSSVAGSFLKGLGNNLLGAVEGTIDAIVHFPTTLGNVANMTTPAGSVMTGASIVQQVQQQKRAFKNGNAEARAAIIGAGVGEILQLFGGEAAEVGKLGKLSKIPGAGKAGKATKTAAKGGSRVFEVGSYNTLKGVETGLEAHHAGQRALMKKFVPGYNANTAPSILVPKQGHTLGSGVLSRGTSGFSNARQVLARDIFELRRVYPNVPNSSLQQLIQMNKTMYPGAFIK